ncbi:LANC-like protein 2 [Plakobranchus ocellatus]|uniref:LANC-like protein 2 n=1 Tax=Plakobranchus ocellatus TaxID=259542 RepID=A0AAV4D9Z5_9GAST|nr:LANC-like protein 2 [Plakobranchus ocellatus]
MASDRAFKNPFSDYSGEHLLGPDKRLKEPYQSKITLAIDKLQKHWVSKLEFDRRDDSIYTGNAGYAFLYLHLHNKLAQPGDSKHLHQALDILKPCLERLRGSRQSFLCGDSGPLALAAVIYHNLGKKDRARKCVEHVEEMHEHVCSDTTLPDEILYGRCGYLSALLFLQKNLGSDCINKEVIAAVVASVLRSGEALSKRERCSHPLMYEWHEKAYLGAAHGLAGIYFMLLQVQEPALQDHIRGKVRPCIDFMLTLRFASGNCPSSLGSSNGDKLVHWCHGAPGWVHMFVLAFKIYKDKRYLDAAKDCAEVVWKRGLLNKGYGICHGPAGNAYTFLTLFKLTGEQKFLYYAVKFAEWCCDYSKHGCRTPDRPMSMFEGLAGTIYFLADILDPLKSAFPSFEFH